MSYLKSFQSATATSRRLQDTPENSRQNLHRVSDNITLKKKKKRFHSLTKKINVLLCQNGYDQESELFMGAYSYLPLPPHPIILRLDELQMVTFTQPRLQGR